MSIYYVGSKTDQYLSCDEISMDQNRLKVTCGEEEIRLSYTEYRLLLLLMQHKGETVTREQLLNHVWNGYDGCVNNNTLTVAMKRLRKKLHRPRCLKTVRSSGYRMEDTMEEALPSRR